MDEKADRILPPGSQRPGRAPGAYESAREGTIDELVAIAGEIWQEVQDSGVDENDDEGGDALYARIREKHRQFAQSFPIVVRWTVQAREYREAAMRKYLGQIKRIGGHWKTREAYVESQAQYLTILYKEIHPRAASRELSQYHEKILQQLKDEDKKFMEANAEADKEIEQQKREVDRERRQRMLVHLRRLQQRK